ncbi:MAG: hypothetical protein WD771_07965 [Gemmatimonadaceae bacterium]
MTVFRAVVAVFVAGACVAPAPSLAQGSCQINGFGTPCTVGGDATHSISLTITEATRLTVASSTVALPVPTDASYNAGVGDAVQLQYNVASNTSWAATISTSATYWTASPISARQDKPAADLQWSTTLNGTYVDLSSTPTALSSGTATAGVMPSIFFRSKFAWLTDAPGSYQILVQVTLTAP